MQKTDRLLFVVLLGMGYWVPDFAEGGQVHTTLKDIGCIKISLAGTVRHEIGAAVSGVGDINGDGFLDAAVGAPAFDPGGFGNEYGNGAVFIINGKTLDKDQEEIDLSPQKFDGWIITGKSESHIGNALARAGDVNGDGFADLAIGSQSHQAGYIVFGQANVKPQISLGELGNRGVEILHTGWTTAPAGDFNGDGYADVLFGNPYSSLISVKDKDYHIGQFTIVYGQPIFPTLIDSFVPGDTHFTDRGSAGALVGWGLAGGMDINQDGFSDIAVVSPKDGADYEGRTFFILGKKALDTVDYAFIIDHARQYVNPANDINGDGYPDLFIGGENLSIYLLWGGKHLKGTLDIRKTWNASWGVQIINGAQTAYGVGDLNGDGFADLVVTMPHAAVGNKLLTGRILILFGRREWPETIDVQTITRGEFTTLDYVLIDGEEAFDLFGSSVAGIGDIQGDGFDDLIVGAPTGRLPDPEGTAKESSGCAYVIQGRNLDSTLHTYRSNFSQSAARR